MEDPSNIFVTGPPRSGKSTLIGEVIDDLNLKAEGLRTPEIRKESKRVGFKLLDVKTGEEGILAHVDREEGPRVSKYRVDVQELERFTRRSLSDLSADCEILVIDEIGTMELFSSVFEQAVKEVLKSEMLVFAVLHRDHVDEYGEQGRVFDLGERKYSEVKEEIKSHIREIQETED